MRLPYRGEDLNEVQRRVGFSVLDQRTTSQDYWLTHNGH